ncbi:MAG TPA: hypothetical protein PKG98_02500 [Myxococcota bacterium]|nr:hypothetical protein [Myxococcota bacterium]
MARSREHKRAAGAKSRASGAEPALLITRAERFESFLHEWGRLVIPIVVFGTLAILHYAGVLGPTALGYAIGLVLLLSMPVAVVVIVLRGYFPVWARFVTIAMTLVYLFATVSPFTDMVFPGKPDFSEELSVARGEVVLPARVEQGNYWVEVFASSFSRVAGAANEQGYYNVMLNGQRLQGKFSDEPLNSTFGSRDGTMISRIKAISLDSGPLTLRATRIDKEIGPEVRVSGHRMAFSPLVLAVMLGLVLLWTTFVDSWFQSQTWRWRLVPWVGVSIVYLGFFYRTWEPARMPSISIWAAVVGGLAGFLGGWLVSLISRRLIGKLRTKI